MELKNYLKSVPLHNDQPIVIRAQRPYDMDELLEGFHRLSPETIRMRFFGPKKDLTPMELEKYGIVGEPYRTSPQLPEN